MERDQTDWNEAAWRWLARAFAMPALLATPARDLSAIALPPSRLVAPEPLVALLGASGVRQDDGARARHATGGGLADQLRRRSGDLSSVPDAVLYPRNEDDVLAALKLCAELGVAVVPFGGGAGDVTPVRGDQGAVAALDMWGLNRVTAIDTMSGLAEVEAGITASELERHLAARGMMLDHSDDLESATLGGWIAQGGGCDWLSALRVATPQGLLTGATMLPWMRGSRGTLGVITRASLRIRALSQKEDTRGYLFPDFASGLAAMREVRRSGVPQVAMRLSDDGETRLSRALQRAGHDWDLTERIFDAWLALRRFDGRAAQMLARFSGNDGEIHSSRKRFEAIARRMGALALGVDTSRRQTFAARRDTLLDRGAALDRLEVPASWSELPSLYVALRAALKQAMRADGPRAGAHGLVLAQVGSARPDGATITVTWAFPRKLDDEIAQAENIRRAAWAACNIVAQDLEGSVLRAIKQVLDPKGILNPGVLP